ncbi:MAG: hypothetical protein ABEH77_04315 [Halobacteriaceae archaeon]
MNARAIPRRRPVPTAVTLVFLLALAATGAYYAGVVPGVPKTLQTFAALAEVTAGAFAVAVAAWLLSAYARQ